MSSCEFIRIVHNFQGIRTLDLEFTQNYFFFYAAVEECGTAFYVEVEAMRIAFKLLTCLMRDFKTEVLLYDLQIAI